MVWAVAAVEFEERWPWSKVIHLLGLTPPEDRGGTAATGGFPSDTRVVRTDGHTYRQTDIQADGRREMERKVM